eukprot:CAMPEP_0203967282 /NCGR_PEP_ID=MMETSP0359-20131031/96313_1 /ASSEMBLY_ACC=CAM_ASM_000338 /TAXON_ID=268821 /ORGANISM="Scrippsiella Hangoei, Strain SHTV-5" /LENGTH=32 /DNA_ID= /DNA_START= /DNA_END= /DNA_ORIENTATION=
MPEPQPHGRPAAAAAAGKPDGAAVSRWRRART